MTAESTTRPISSTLVTVMAVATGITVANLYYLQPLLHNIKGDFTISTSNASLLITMMQIGYAVGLAFIVPLGDFIPRRRLIVAIFLISAVAMGLGALTTSYVPFALATLVIGLSSVGGQVILPFAADVAAPDERGRVLARVMTGLIMGLLLSRSVSGLIAQAFGWRTVYWSATSLLIISALVLRQVLPDEPIRPHVPYRTLVAGSFSLFVTNAEFLRRAWLGAVTFGSFSVVWTTLAFHLSGAPFHYSKAIIGLFGLFGVAGVTAANFGGHHVDKERGHLVTLIASSLVTLSFAVLSLGRDSFWSMALGLIMLDFGMQGMQITNQSVIYNLMPDARSRINSAFMVSCFIGAAFGSFSAGRLYDRFGWSGVCTLGALGGLCLLVPSLFWKTPSLRDDVRIELLDP